MYCTNCGARTGDVNFCQRCGVAVRRDDDDREARRRSSASDRDDVRDEPKRGAEPAGKRSTRGRAEDYIRDPSRTQELLAAALSKASARRSTDGIVDEIWEYLQTVARLIQASVTGEYKGLSGKRLTLMIAAILYYVSPIDIIPDFFPVAGLLDDLGVLAFALRSMKDEIEAFKAWERDQGRRKAS